MHSGQQARGRVVAGWAVLAFLLFPGQTRGEEEYSFAGPLLLRNENPLYLTVFSTAIPDSVRTTVPRHWKWDFHYLCSNTIMDQHNVTESDRVVVDGELQRFELRVKYGLGRGWELSAALPYLTLGGGYLDGFIKSFEDTFGFITPGARESRPEGKFKYLFRVNGESLIDETGHSLDGLGDIPLQLKYRLWDRSAGLLPRLSVRGLLKLPTATQSKLGNGRLDGGIGLLAEQPIGSRVLFFSNLDVTTAHLPLALKTIDVDPVIVSGSFGLEHCLTKRASWLLQMTASSNPYPTFQEDMGALNRNPMGVGLGWAYRLFSRTRIRVSVVENINTSWQDFSWNFSLKTES